MALQSFERIFKSYSISEFAKYKRPYFDSLAITVQEYLYTDGAASDEDEYFDCQMDRHITLYDLMTLTDFFISASVTELGKAKMKKYIAILQQERSSNYHYTEAVEYTQDNGLLIVNARSEIIVSVLWAAWIYARVLQKRTQKATWESAVNMLYKEMREYFPYNDNFFNKHPLIEHAGDALAFMEEQISKRQSKDNHPSDDAQRKQPVASAEKESDNEKLKARCDMLKAENEKLKTQLEHKCKPVTKPIRIKKEFQSKMSQFLHLAWKKKMFEDEKGGSVTLKEVNDAFTEFLDFDFNAWSGNLSTLYKGGNWKGLENDIGEVIDTQESLQDFIKKVSEDEHKKRNP